MLLVRNPKFPFTANGLSMFPLVVSKKARMFCTCLFGTPVLKCFICLSNFLDKTVFEKSVLNLLLNIAHSLDSHVSYLRFATSIYDVDLRLRFAISMLSCMRSLCAISSAIILYVVYFIELLTVK